MTRMCHLNPSDGEKDKSSTPNGCYEDCNRKSFSEKYEKEDPVVNGFSPYVTPLISPSPSLSSYGSCSSSSGEIPLDMNSLMREDGAGSLDTGQEHISERIARNLEEHGNGSLYNGVDIYSSDSRTYFDGSKLSTATKENYSTSSLTMEGHEHSNGEKVGPYISTSLDIHLTRAGDDSDGADSGIDHSQPSLLPKNETDLLIWVPPEPEDMEDEIDSVANNDDDDNYNDGTKWGQPTSLSSFDEEHGSGYSYREERQKAMMEAMNGQFKILVSRFLASEDLTSPDTESCENWLDIVTSLSWEAALFVKPDAGEGRAMDPGSYVKVKCIASGARSESQVVKGLVFKKNTAHKHMPTKFKNPRLVLVRGVLGTSAVGLSSFDSMEQEKDFLKSIMEMIDACHPNVVLVEKTVSRDIQECLLSKGITLVFDMKLPRLERIACCIGSQIVSCADLLMKPMLKQCDSFHVQKFVEEHNSSGEGGKKPCKTLMFLEGCPKPLGCTILLKGARRDELKKMKRVIHYTVFAAYHLILETSFFADQRTFFSDMHAVRERKGSSTDRTLPFVSENAATSNFSCTDNSAEDFAPAHELDINILEGSPKKNSHGETHFDSDLGLNASSAFPSSHPDIDAVKYNLLHGDFSNSSAPSLLPGHLLSSVSASLKSLLGDRFPSLNSQTISSYFGFEEKELDSANIDVFSVPQSLEEIADDTEVNPELNQEKADERVSNGEIAGVASHFTEVIEKDGTDISNREQMPNNDIESVLDPQSILILLSSQCITKGVVCEQSHLSRIKYYGNFDLSLGRYLQDTLLNKKHRCGSCAEPPEAHVYSYTHHNGRLIVLVKQLTSESYLPGEAEGKIWMWTRCLKCVHERGIPRSTRRVVMSTAARSLSFGKFLELSFSSNSAASRLSRCGHLLHRDCLRFFGLGSKVAMFRYSGVEIYAACKPPSVLEFYNPNGQEWLKREAGEVLAKGNHFFLEVANLLQKLKLNSGFLSKNLVKISGSFNGVYELEEMLFQEKTEFEASLQKAINCIGQMGRTMDEMLDLNWLRQELLLELYVWDQRLHSLMLCSREISEATHSAVQEFEWEKDANSFDKNSARNATENSGMVPEVTILIPVEESSSSSGSDCVQNMEIELEVEPSETSSNMKNRIHGSIDAGIAVMQCLREDLPAGSMTEEHGAPALEQDPNARREECDTLLDHMQVDHSVPNSIETLEDGDRATDLERKLDETISVDNVSSVHMVSEKYPGANVYKESQDSKREIFDGWIWMPFSELRRAYRKDLHGGYLQKFGFVHSYKPSYLSPMCQQGSQEINSLHFPVGAGGNVMSVCKDEISSIIACALALSEDQSGLLEQTGDKEDGDGKAEAADRAIDKSYSLASGGSVVSSYWSSTGSVDSEGMRSSQSVLSFSSDELSTSGSEGSLFVDRLGALESLHLEIPIGISKIDGGSKYSVVCIHAKEFYDLRKRCCPSELAYISSLSRCKKWDATGGKSKAFFAKSMDDRFILKQIKKAEFDSFLKFAPDYFKHVTMSLDSGSQTCLAKILGIYQVKQNKGGKEVKIDLVVMENLLYGRNVTRTYDLKGAVFSRYVPDVNDPQTVFLDENFVEDMRVSPIYVRGRTKHLLQRAIWNDTAFLTSINVMDYSLLVGVDKEGRELVFGIIDYLRQYTWDKQLETWVKSSLVVPRNELPTVISPKEYKKRFRKFMTKYFLTVPDTWSSELCSGPCKFCVAGSSSSSDLHTVRSREQLSEA